MFYYDSEGESHTTATFQERFILLTKVMSIRKPAVKVRMSYRYTGGWRQRRGREHISKRLEEDANGKLHLLSVEKAIITLEKGIRVSSPTRAQTS